jgi:aerobic carbon-monoxide dehydrogenase medium subunit
VLVPRLSADARWGHAKYAKKAGDFAESMAIAVRDDARGFACVVLGRRAEPPALLRRTSEQARADSSRENLAAAVEADLAELLPDRTDWTLHRAIVTRAVRDLRA